MLNKLFERMTEILTNQYDDIDVEKYKSMDEDDALVSGHHTLGRALRNDWGLWGDNELTQWFNTIGIFHADDMSAIISTSFHRHLNNKDIDLDGQVAYYKKYWKEMEGVYK